MKNLGFILVVIGVIMLAVGNIGGIGYGLYLWGGTGMELGLAAWTAFKFWLTWGIIGLVSFFSGLFLK
jgi:hypothetical protein